MSPEEKKRQIDMANGFYGFNRHNEIQIVDVDDGTSVIEVPLRKESNNPLGIAHGGLIFSICDVAAGVAALGRNMAWLLKNLRRGDAIPRPADEPWQPMHFIR